MLFFFPRKSLKATHSPEARISTKKGQKHVFFVFFSHLGCFFFPTFFCFFFSQEKFTHHSLTQFWEAGKKKQQWKKKQTHFSLTQSIFAQIVQKKNYSGEIKKYGTFAKTYGKLVYFCRGGGFWLRRGGVSSLQWVAIQNELNGISNDK